MRDGQGAIDCRKASAVYSKVDITRVLGSNAAAYAGNKNRGGRNNAKGATYEAYYAGARAITLLADALRSGDSGEAIFLEEQQLCFIDDLIVDTPALRTLSQIKSGSSTKWTGGNHPIATDFTNQAALDAALGVTAQYELVVPTSDLKSALEASLPAGVSAQVIAFSDRHAINEFLEDNPNLVADIDEIALTDRPRASVRGQVVKTILGAWATIGARTSLADLARHAADGPGPVVTVLGPEYVLQEDVRAQLAQVEGLDFAITKKHLWYDFKGIRGSSPFRGGTDEFTRFERFIVDNKVTDGFAVIKALREDA
nr:hypothetical protein [Brevundimonas diminuta]